MREYLKRASIVFLLIALCPFVLGFINSWNEGLGFFLFLLGVPAALLCIAGAVVIFLWRGIKLARQPRLIGHKILAVVATPAMLAAVVLLAVPSIATGAFVGHWTRLMVNRGHYEAIIAKARANPEAQSFSDDDGVTYSVDIGPPVRVAFNPAGMLDNWHGIIFDPTADVMLAKGFDPRSGKFFAPDRVTKLFGGDLVSCRHLWGDYYTCSFT